MGVLRHVTNALLQRLPRNRRRLFVRRLAGFAHRLYLAYENFDYDPATNGEYEILRKIATIEPDPVVFDVGANTGGWALAAAVIVPNARIHCFELAGRLARELRANVAVQKRISVNEFGLAEREADVEFTFYPNTTVFTSMYDYPHDTVSVRDRGHVRTGDAYMLENGIDRISLLKLDVEGAEPLVLKGLSRALEQGRIDSVQFEYGRINLAAGFLLRDFYALFERHGFAVGKVYPTYVEFREYHPLHEDLLGPNFLAVRKARKDWIEVFGR